MFIFIYICFALVVPIIYFILKPYAVFKKNIILNVTLPSEAKKDSFVNKQIVLFKRWLLLISVLILISYTIYAFFIVKSMGHFAFFSFNWFLLAIVLPHIILIYFNRRLHKYKIEKDWGLAGNIDKDGYIDDDQYWVGGLFYYNPNDNHILVNDRVGMGMSMNIGKPIGKIFYGVTALLLLLMPFMGAWILIEEETPISISLDNNNVIFSHINDYKIKFDDIQEIELIYELPNTVKLSGTELDNLMKGTFKVNDGIGKANLNLNPNVSPYILINTKDETYILGSENGEETAAIYTDILDQFNK